MPITITPPTGGIFGPGLGYAVRSDFPGTIPPNSFFRFSVNVDPEQAQPIYLWDIPIAALQYSSVAFADPTSRVGLVIGRQAQEGTQVYFHVSLESPTQLLDSGQVQVTWDETAGIGLQAERLADRHGEGGFTQTDRGLLEQTNALTQQLLTLSNTIQGAVLTTVRTTSGDVLTPISDFFGWIHHQLFDDREISGETCERIDASIALQNYFSLTLHITQFPEDWRFQTPDMAWGFHDLAVVTVWSGDMLLARHGVHALQHTLQPIPGTIWWGKPIAEAPFQPPGLRVTVDWAPGVCGRLTGKHWPL